MAYGPGSPTHHARLTSGCWSGSTGRDWLPAGFHLKGFKAPDYPPFPSFLAQCQVGYLMVMAKATVCRCYREPAVRTLDGPEARARSTCAVAVVPQTEMFYYEKQQQENDQCPKPHSNSE